MSTNPPTAILLLTCPDQKGLVAATSDFITRHGGNIVHADQHTDREEGVFVQRIEFEIDGFALPRERMSEAFAAVAHRFDMQWSMRFSDQRQRLAILVSRHGHCLHDLLGRWALGELAGECKLIISNHPDMASAAGGFGIDYHHLPIAADTKPQQEKHIHELLANHDIDLVILARYMQVLSDDFVSRYRNRIINIHHSFLPAFAGGRPYHQAHVRGVKIIGATAHYVTADLDQGPIIDQDVARVSHRDSVPDLVHKGRDLEKTVLARAVHLHLEHRVLVYGDKTVVFD